MSDSIVSVDLTSDEIEILHDMLLEELQCLKAEEQVETGAGELSPEAQSEVEELLALFNKLAMATGGTPVTWDQVEPVEEEK